MPIPTATFQGERENSAEHHRATISVMNVYKSDFTWPDDTRITDLRIIQVFPKPWNSPLANNPRIGYSDSPNVRMVLGTVPVEEDGSAYFEAPVEKEIYFQALDERGMAVQSMRSGTYVHPGEQLSCLGCHEDKWEAVPPMGGAGCRLLLEGMPLGTYSELAWGVPATSLGASPPPPWGSWAWVPEALAVSFDRCWITSRSARISPSNSSSALFSSPSASEPPGRPPAVCSPSPSPGGSPRSDGMGGMREASVPGT